MKRITVLTAVFLFGTVVMAQKPDISWFASNPDAKTFSIANADQLAGLAALVNNIAGLGQAVDFDGKTIVLTDNVDLSVYGENYNNKQGWLPIGYENSFHGIFDGKGKTISGLYINRGGWVAGLFGKIGKRGEVKNLGLVNVRISGSRDIGAIVGNFSGRLIAKCYSTGSIVVPGGGGISVGGIAGNFVGSDVSEKGMVDCYSSATVKSYYQAGGLIGSFEGSQINGCYFTGVVEGTKSIGGIVGLMGRGSIGNCYSAGVVSGSVTSDEGSYVGGIVGAADGGRIFNCYSTSVVVGRLSVGGILGSWGFGSSGNNEVINCYSTGSVSGVNYVGGVVGSETYRGGKVSNCAALNPSIKASGSNFGRVTGGGEVVSQGIVAFAGMTNSSGNTLWINKTATEKNGLDITADKIKTDPTIGGRFTIKNGWVTKIGKLPGLGATVDMPEHLK